LDPGLEKRLTATQHFIFRSFFAFLDLNLNPAAPTIVSPYLQHVRATCSGPLFLSDGLFQVFSLVLETSPPTSSPFRAEI